MPREKVFDMPCRGVNLMPLKSQHATTGAITLLGSPLLKILGVPLANVLGEWYAGASDNNYFRDISGNSRHLTGTNGPTFADSTLVGWDGNPLKAYSFTAASSQKFSLAHDSWMDCFDGSHSVSCLVRSPSSIPGAGLGIFSHGVANTSGAYFSFTATGYFGGYYHKSGGSTAALTPSTIADGLWHLVHFVRNGNFVTAYIDGVPGTPADVSTGGPYGIDGSASLLIGSVSGGSSNFFDGPISYVRLQNTALEYYQIQREVAAFQGILASRGSGRYVVPYFTRASTTYTNRRAGSVSQVQVPSNWPARSADQGLRIEASKSSATNGNLFTYTTTFPGACTMTGTNTISATSVTLPDGSTSTQATFHEGTDAASTQFMYRGFSVTSGTTYCLSWYFKYNPAAGTPREWVKLYFGDTAQTNTAFINIRNGTIGTETKGMTGGSGVEPGVDGYYRFWIWGTATTTATGTVRVYAASANGTDTFDGANQDSFFFCWPQIETGAFPTSYLARPTDAAVTRAADFCIVQPFNLNKELAGLVAATPRLLLNGTESLNGATVTPTVGAYSLTKNGRPQQGWSEAEGYHGLYNGSSDYLSLADTGVGDPFRPAGAFSIVFAWTPHSVTGYNPMFRKQGSSGNYGYQVYSNGTTILFERSTTGSDTVTRQVASCLEIGKPVLVTASFSASGGTTIRVDAFSASNIAGSDLTFGSSATLYIGGIPSTNYLTGKIHYVAYYDGYEVTAAEHAAMYTRLKQDGILPKTMSSTTTKTKFTIECDVKGQYSSLTDMGQYRRLVTVLGTYGTADGDTNNIQLYADATSGKSVFNICPNVTTPPARSVSSAARTDHNRWTRHVATFDCSSPIMSSYYIDGVAQTTTAGLDTTPVDIDFRDTLIHLGYSVAAGINGNADFRDIKLYTE